jgi:hypothetical protein
MADGRVFKGGIADFGGYGAFKIARQADQFKVLLAVVLLLKS